MSQLDLDEADEHRFRHAAGGYGVEVHGGNPSDRLSELEARLDDPQVVVDCRSIGSAGEFVEAALREAGVDSKEVEALRRPSSRHLARGLTDADASLIITSFDSMPSDVQTAVAQTMKGLCERREFEQMVGYACSEGGAVVRAERDLSMRVQSFELTD